MNPKINSVRNAPKSIPIIEFEHLAERRMRAGVRIMHSAHGGTKHVGRMDGNFE